MIKNTVINTDNSDNQRGSVNCLKIDNVSIMATIIIMIYIMIIVALDLKKLALLLFLVVKILSTSEANPYKDGSAFSDRRNLAEFFSSVRLILAHSGCFWYPFIEKRVIA